MKRYEEDYSETSFWKKVRAVGAKVGYDALESVLCLYYALPKAPARQKAVILGALGYFIVPLDAVPDFIPAVGYADDWAAVAAAVAVVAASIDDEVRAKARATLARLGLRQEKAPA